MGHLPLLLVSRGLRLIKYEVSSHLVITVTRLAHPLADHSGTVLSLIASRGSGCLQNDFPYVRYFTATIDKIGHYNLIASLLVIRGFAGSAVRPSTLTVSR